MIIQEHYTHWRKHKPYGAKINIKNPKHSYDAWAKNAFVTDINDKDFTQIFV